MDGSETKAVTSGSSLVGGSHLVCLLSDFFLLFSLDCKRESVAERKRKCGGEMKAE